MLGAGCRSLNDTVATARHLAAGQRRDGIDRPGKRDSLKQQQPRETAPLWVWLAIALMLIIGIVYVTSYWMVEEVIAHKK